MYTEVLVLFTFVVSAAIGVKTSENSRSECLDIAIVGGGIGGTYTGWRFRDRGLKIAIFENTDRIGGRMFSVFLPSVPNVPADLGAMRFLPGVHYTLESLLPKLGLQSEVFQPDRFDKMYYLRGTRLRHEELDSPKLPYNLAPGESRNPDELRWNLSQRALNMTEPDKIPDVEEAVTPDGVPLYKQGYLNVMGTIWSNEAREYFKGLDSFRTFYEPNMNAIHDIIASPPQTPKLIKRTVIGGMNEVPQRLARQFLTASYRHKIILNRRVDSIRKVRHRGKYVYELRVYETQTLGGFTKDKWVNPHTICADNVILALPVPALKNIKWFPLQHHPSIQTALNALTDFTAMKIFLAYPSAWWDSLRGNKAFVTDLPLRQGGEFGRFRNSSGDETAMMMVSYADGVVNNDYWREMRSFRDIISSPAVPAAFSVNTKVVQHVHHHLASIYDVSSSSIPWPIDGVMHIWNSPQNGGAWQRYNPGYKPKLISQFMKRPSSSDRVFIVTNSFCRTLSTWAEGSLRAADEVLGEFFNLML